MMMLTGMFMASVATANLLTPIGTERPTSISPSGLSTQNSLIEGTLAQYNLLPPVNLPEQLIETRAIPTNKWWGNLIHQSENEDIQSSPVYMNPYTLEMQLDSVPYGIQVTHSHRYVGTGEVNENGAIKFYTHGIGIKDLVFSAQEFDTKPRINVTNWDDFVVQAEMVTDQGKIISHMNLGTAFINAQYVDLTPSIQSQHAIDSVNDLSSGTFTGRKFVIKLNNGQTWVVYSDQEISFTKEENNLVAASAFNGLLRTALLSNDDENQYDAYASCMIKSAALIIPNSNEYSIRWNTDGNCENGVLNFALQHQLESLNRNNLREIEIQLPSTTRGMMRAFATTPGSVPQWTFNEPDNVEIGFYPPRRASKETLENYNVLELLSQDIDASWQLPQRGSYYFTGKLALKYANLCLMANDEVLVGQDQSLKAKCIQKLQDNYGHFLDNTWAYPLVYDEVYRGVSSSEAFATNDRWRDFGNTLYNDHHYHYGYWIQAGAILMYLDPTWNRIDDLENMVNVLVRDAANPSDLDEWFPKFRNFDWFQGHSYSHGVSAFEDGKDEESTSEEMAFHYGLMLWGNASGNSNLELLGKLMLKVNKRAINTYFLMSDDNQVHPPEFIKNKVAGIFFDNKVDYATWFCGERECIHGIQMIPVSPINEMFRTAQFVREEWEQVLSKLAITTDPNARSAWQSLLYANVATIDKELALEKLSTVPLDDGLSRSWALYYAATRPGADVVPTNPPADAVPTNPPADVPTAEPTEIPTETPTEAPVEAPTDTPTPVDRPTPSPSIYPSPTPAPTPCDENATEEGLTAVSTNYDVTSDSSPSLRASNNIPAVWTISIILLFMSQ